MLRLFRIAAERIAYIQNDHELSVALANRPLTNEDYRFLPRLLDNPLRLWQKTSKWLHDCIGALGDLRGPIEDWFEEPITTSEEPDRSFG